MIAAVRWSTGVEDAWTRIAVFIPKFIGFLIILLIGYLIAKTIAKIANRVLERVGFDKAVERGGVAKAMEHTKFDASDIVGKVIFYALMLIVLQMAFGVFGTNPVSALLAGIIAYLPKVVVAILIIVIASAVAAAVKEIVEATLGGLSYGRSLAIGASIAIIAIGFFAALDQLQIAPRIVTGLFYAVLAALTGIAIIAVGGGGIAPMRRRWEAALERYDQEKQHVAQAKEGAGERIQQRYQERKDQVQGAMQQPANSPAAPGSYSAGQPR